MLNLPRRRPVARRTMLAALVTSMALVVGGCGGSGAVRTDDAEAGDPVRGGTMRVVQGGEPRSLDPATLVNAWVSNSLIGNALYGTLLVNDPETLELTPVLAESFETSDGGATFELELREGIRFSDGTPYDAEAVRYNWERMRDQNTGSPSLIQASQITALEVTDPLTLRVILASPNPHYAQAVVWGGLNWIASPTALEAGRQAFDDHPVGAGPFTMTQWRRQDRIILERNPGYEPAPYLDGIELVHNGDTNQRVNAVISGQAGLAIEGSWATLGRAEDAGLRTLVEPSGGGQFLALNTRRAPFDDERARRALAHAIDIDALNEVVFAGRAELPRTLFDENSPFYADIPISTHDPDTAQQLFDELAAEGKPVSFTFLAYTSVENKAVAEAVQAQLSAFDGVDVQVEVLDFTAALPRLHTYDFDVAITSATILDPDTALWSNFHGDSTGNFSGINDPELNAAIDEGRTAAELEDRAGAYETAQQRIVDLNPVVWYIRTAPAAVLGEGTQGVQMYGMGSIRPELLWTTTR
ncbi:ABC transporter substrate-binding protein [Rhodococcus artemisiae]|uniref:ABC transporter substrate-binding protein n=1 Tax=Rhodococcus artemisiae TaxID=714159 RepID=A0ABU7L3Z2_9NOCA|nr:ABC transporter substrate-binding protein [Rhodococcus artemisiae]MEE2056062.1 ABC transporter substrate-binding protein [Rhodococcus artemisiae]